MQSGRKPKPTAVKALEGNPGKRSLNTGEPKPEETGLGEIECRLNLVEVADETFKDGGHAMQWAISRA